jgi:hypothetical protein
MKRRTFSLSAPAVLSVYLSAIRRGYANDAFSVLIRADEQVRGILPPVATRTLTIQPDLSPAAQDMASRAPAGRAVPVILIMVGAIGLVQIGQMINEMVRQVYYGGVVVDGRKTPPEITNDPKIPPSMVLVFQADGTVKQFSGGDVPANLLELVLKAKN